MFDQILKLIELVLGRLPDLNYSGLRKRAFGKSLLQLHAQLLKISENGDELLTMLDEYRRTEALDAARLESLISDQERLIADVSELVESNKYVDVLNIKLPYLLPMQVISEKKRQLADIRVWLDFRLTPASLSVARDFGVHTALREYRKDGYALRAPSEAYIRIGNEMVGKIRDNCEQLRQFLDQSFSVDELL